MFKPILVLSLCRKIDHFDRCTGIVWGPPLISNRPMCPYFILRENGKRNFNMCTFMSIKVFFLSWKRAWPFQKIVHSNTVICQLRKKR